MTGNEKRWSSRRALCRCLQKIKDKYSKIRLVNIKKRKEINKKADMQII